MRLKRFFRTPKGLLIIVLAILTVFAAFGPGVPRVALSLATGMIAGMIVDAPILRVRDGEWVFPDGALLTGWIVALILSPREPGYVIAVTTAIGVVSKYL
ncbi:MAG TPA: RnfABCDGE type electron transport complex subunit D, partial [Gemmatimonadaceae bacterium]|nr:RnfABCDGE type electron transport complex subunit D [Gemmatimonadaceae bacterium]